MLKLFITKTNDLAARYSVVLGTFLAKCCRVSEILHLQSTASKGKSTEHQYSKEYALWHSDIICATYIKEFGVNDEAGNQTEPLLFYTHFYFIFWFYGWLRTPSCTTDSRLRLRFCSREAAVPAAYLLRVCKTQVWPRLMRGAVGVWLVWATACSLKKRRWAIHTGASTACFIIRGPVFNRMSWTGSLQCF